MKMIRCLTPLLFISLFIPLSANAKKGPPSIHGDVRLDVGKKKIDNAPAIVEYQGPCGAKKSISVVNLWRKRVVGATLWISRNDGTIIEPPEGGARVIGHRCEFSPMLTIVRPGSVVKVFNNDPYTQWLILEEDGERKRQIMQEPDGKPLELKVHDGKKYHIKSGFYPWMEAWIGIDGNVVATTSTDETGHFMFENVLPGEYTLHAWHPSLGHTSKEISVSGNKDRSVKVVYSMPEKIVPVVEASGLEKILGTDHEKGKNDNPFKK